MCARARLILLISANRDVGRVVSRGAVSNSPGLLRRWRFQNRLGVRLGFADGRPPEAYTQAPFTPWPERDPDMTDAAAALGRSQGISRQAQDEWAVESHAKARAHLPSETELVPLAGSGSDTFTRPPPGVNIRLSRR